MSPFVATGKKQEGAADVKGLFVYNIFFFFCTLLLYFPVSGQAVVTGVVPSSPWFLPSIFIAHRVQQYHCSSIFHRVLLTHAPALSASQFVHKKKSSRIYTSMPSGGSELTKLTYTRLEVNLIRHRGDPLEPHGWPPLEAEKCSVPFRGFIASVLWRLTDGTVPSEVQILSQAEAMLFSPTLQRLQDITPLDGILASRMATCVLLYLVFDNCREEGLEICLRLV